MKFMERGSMEENRIRIVAEAGGGMEALAYLRSNPVDILLTHIQMSEMDGLELAEYSKAEGLCRCVVLISDSADFECARRGIVMGAFDFMVRPVKEEQLRDTLERACEFLDADGRNNGKIAETATLETKISEIKTLETEAAQCILQSNGNMEKWLGALLLKCTKGAEKDGGKADRTKVDEVEQTVNETGEIDGVHERHGIYGIYGMEVSLPLANISRSIFEKVIGAYPWLEYVTEDEKGVENQIIHARDTASSVEIFRRYVWELYDKAVQYYPQGISGLSQNAARYILNHPYERATLTELAKMCCVSNAYLSHIFKRDMGKSLMDYIMMYKMDILKNMLCKTDQYLTELAELLGYNDYKYMGRIFKRQYGFSPAEYRKRKKKNGGYSL